MTEVATAPAKERATIRCKASCGVTLTWRVGKNRDGKFKALSCGTPRPHMPLDFLPFKVMDAVYNRHTVFETLDEAVRFVRSL
jgi:hypothetical protein